MHDIFAICEALWLQIACFITPSLCSYCSAFALTSSAAAASSSSACFMLKRLSFKTPDGMGILISAWQKGQICSSFQAGAPNQYCSTAASCSSPAGQQEGLQARLILRSVLTSSETHVRHDCHLKAMHTPQLRNWPACPRAVTTESSPRTGAPSSPSCKRVRSYHVMLLLFQRTVMRSVAVAHLHRTKHVKRCP
jgi:hypothetical protein